MVSPFPSLRSSPPPSLLNPHSLYLSLENEKALYQLKVFSLMLQAVVTWKCKRLQEIAMVVDRDPVEISSIEF